jgi:hypothetical protein
VRERFNLHDLERVREQVRKPERELHSELLEWCFNERRFRVECLADLCLR